MKGLPPEGFWRLLAGYLAFEWLHWRVHDHMGLEGLFLHKGLEADVTLVRTDAGVYEHVPLHVGLQGELTPAHLTLEFLHTLQGSQKRMPHNLALNWSVHI